MIEQGCTDSAAAIEESLEQEHRLVGTAAVGAQQLVRLAD